MCIYLYIWKGKSALSIKNVSICITIVRVHVDIGAYLGLMFFTSNKKSELKI